MQDGADFQGQRCSGLRLIGLLVVGSKKGEVNSRRLIAYLVYEGSVNILYFPEVLSHDPRS